MFSKLERTIAFRYLRSKRKEGFISVIAGFSFVGIALGVATLIVVMAVMNGFRTEITNKILGIGGHVNVSAYERKITDYDQIVNKIQQNDKVKTAIPMIDNQAMVSTKYSSAGALIKAFSPDGLKKKELLYNNIDQVSFAKFSTKKDNILIGEHLAQRLGAKVGEKITLISSKGRATAMGTIPRLKSYEVAGVFNIGMYEYDNNVIIMPLSSAQIFFRLKESVNLIEIFTDDSDNSDLVAKEIDTILAQSGLFLVSDWKKSNSSLFNALKVERTVMFFILTLIVFIAAFNIISSLIMLVNDKNNDIAILRTIGMSKWSVMLIFFFCGSFIGVVGTILGLIIGVSFASNIESIKQFVEKIIGGKLFDPVVYFLSELPSDIQADDVLWSVSVGLIFSLLATLYPAYKASTKDPAEVLRYE